MFARIEFNMPASFYLMCELWKLSNKNIPRVLAIFVAVLLTRLEIHIPATYQILRALLTTLT